MKFQSIEWVETIPSTNSCLMKMAADTPELPSGSIIATLNQTAGRGRFERKWLSNPGQDLTFSFLLRTLAPQTQLPSLPMACALGIVKYLNSMTLKAATKWPNDVLIGGKKICGILTEQVTSTDSNELIAVVGIGLNVNMGIKEVNLIDKPATSIAIELGSKDQSPVAEVLDNLLPHLALPINSWQDGGFPSIREEWLNNTTGIGQKVGIQGNGKIITGEVSGFGDLGELLLQDSSGGTHPVWSGDLVLSVD